MQVLRHVMIAFTQDITFGQLDHQLLYRISAEPIGVQIAQQLAVAEMTRRHVNTNMKIGILREIMQPAGGFSDDVAGQGDYQVVAFSNRDKNIRRDISAARIVPAQQNFHATTLLST